MDRPNRVLQQKKRPGLQILGKDGQEVISFLSHLILTDPFFFVASYLLYFLRMPPSGACGPLQRSEWMALPCRPARDRKAIIDTIRR